MIGGADGRIRVFDRRVLDLALPAVATAMVPLVHRAVDMAFCKQLGTEATAALTVATISVWICQAFGLLVGIGLCALVARYSGAGRTEGARYVGSQGWRWAGVVGAMLGLAGIAVAPLVFAGAGASPDVVAQGVPYARIYWASGLFVIWAFAGDAIFRGHGNTRVPMRIAVIGLLVNVVLDPLLIFGLGPVPGLGVAGAAWATLFATALAAALYWRTLRATRYVAPERPADDELAFHAKTRLGAPGSFGLDRVLMGRIVRVGIPVAVMAVLFNLVYLVIMRCADEAGGPAVQAGLGVGHTGEGVAFVIGMGFAAAAAALVGRALGAGDPDLAERHAWTAFVQCGLVAGIWGIALYVFADPIAALFAQEVDARAYGADYFRIVAWCLVPQAAEQVFAGAFGGAGMTLPPTIVGISMSLARIPLAYYAAFELDLGATGIFLVIAITAAARGVAILIWFTRGTWKTQDV